MFDEDVYYDVHPFGRIPPKRSGMYYGNVILSELPRRADAATYEKYARLPSWHVEEAAALVVGFEPRASTQFFPSEGLPRNPDQPEVAAPNDGAVTWNALLHGAVGQVLALYARYKHVPPWGFHSDMLYVRPDNFLAFCAEYMVPVPADLARHFPNATPAASAQTRRSAVPKEQRYRKQTLQVALELNERAAPLTVQQLKDLVESGFAPTEHTVTPRTYQQYLEKWRRDTSPPDPLSGLLAQVLRTALGRPSEDEDNELKKRLPEKFRRILWPINRAAKKLRK